MFLINLFKNAEEERQASSNRCYIIETKKSVSLRTGQTIQEIPI